MSDYKPTPLSKVGVIRARRVCGKHLQNCCAHAEYNERVPENSNPQSSEVKIALIITQKEIM